MAEVEKVTAYNGLAKKEALRLRLLAEELTGMLRELVNNFEGCFWLQNEEKKYELHAEFSVYDMSMEEKQALIDLSATKKNAAVSGFMSRIREIAENMLLYSQESGVPLGCFASYDYLNDYSLAGVHYAYAWTLDNYIAQQKEKPVNKSEDWDRLEQSIVANLADDVIVGVKGQRVAIVIKKDF
jgi:hypothetical protein